MHQNIIFVLQEAEKFRSKIRSEVGRSLWEIGEIKVGEKDFLGRLEGARLQIKENEKGEMILCIGWFKEGKMEGAAIKLFDDGNC